MQKHYFERRQKKRYTVCSVLYQKSFIFFDWGWAGNNCSALPHVPINNPPPPPPHLPARPVPTSPHEINPIPPKSPAYEGCIGIGQIWFPGRMVATLVSPWWMPQQTRGIQCCFNVGPASKTVGQHWNNIGWIPRVCWLIFPFYLTVWMWNFTVNTGL